jgi:hypothetical protein
VDYLCGWTLPLAGLAYLLPETVGTVLFAVPLVLLPAAAGIAILLYRLYDIDRLINRTLVYGLLTALLAGVYASVVLVLGAGVRRGGKGHAELGGGQRHPGRGRPVSAGPPPHPAVVDRRFNRRRYDAAKAIQAYSLRLCDQVDLDTLSAELLAVVDQTVQPTRVSFWLRPAPPGSSGPAHDEARPTPWAY